MKAGRRLEDVDRGAAIRIELDGRPIDCRAGETIGVALLAADERTLRITPRRARPRGLFCAMGVCFECLVEVDGRTGVRACLTTVRDGMVVRTTRSEPGP